MAISSKAIKQKIKGVSNIGKITRTMEMVSVSKMKKAVSASVLIKPFSEKAADLLAHISSETINSHPYFLGNNSDSKIIVIVSSNKGLAGSYNTNIYKKLNKSLQEGIIDKKNTVSICIGKQAEKISKRLGIDIKASYINITDIPTYEEALSISEMFMDSYLSGDVGKVYAIYTEYYKAMSYAPSISQILPINNENKDKIKLIHESKKYKETLFEPSQSRVIDQTVPKLITSNLLSMLADSSASEHSSRMFAMKTASDNAKEIKRILTISYNKARQDAVTQELAEIAAGTTS